MVIAKREEIDYVLNAIKSIRDKEGKNTQIRGKIDCPKCTQKDSLFYTIAFNGHIFGKCKCGLGWMM